MTAIDKIRTALIDKILAIKDKEFLEALDKLIASSKAEDEIVALTKEQKTMLDMSENDIKEGKLISQDAMKRRNLEWLNEI